MLAHERQSRFSFFGRLVVLSNDKTCAALWDSLVASRLGTTSSCMTLSTRLRLLASAPFVLVMLLCLRVIEKLNPGAGLEMWLRGK